MSVKSGIVISLSLFEEDSNEGEEREEWGGKSIDVCSK